MVAACIVAAIGASATPAAATIYTFALADHPDGNQRPPLYGLRLDELINATGGHDVYTFSFGGSDMRLDYNDNGTAGGGDDSIRIYGQASGGAIRALAMR